MALPRDWRLQKARVAVYFADQASVWYYQLRPSYVHVIGARSILKQSIEVPMSLYIRYIAHMMTLMNWNWGVLITKAQAKPTQRWFKFLHTDVQPCMPKQSKFELNLNLKFLAFIVNRYCIHLLICSRIHAPCMHARISSTYLSSIIQANAPPWPGHVRQSDHLDVALACEVVQYRLDLRCFHYIAVLCVP